MIESSGICSPSLWPPVKLYLGKPLNLTAGGGSPGANSGAKSNTVMDVLSLCGFAAVLGKLVALAIVIAIAFSPDRGIRHMRRLQLAVFLFACALATGAAAEYPERPIHLIVPQAARSVNHTVGRLLR